MDVAIRNSLRSNKKLPSQVKIPLRVHLAHAQSGWLSFLNRIKRALEIEDIDGVYEDANGAPVVRIASLVDDGLYFVRPTEVRTYAYTGILRTRGMSKVFTPQPKPSTPEYKNIDRSENSRNVTHPFVSLERHAYMWCRNNAGVLLTVVPK